jgi:hypothetical protein
MGAAITRLQLDFFAVSKPTDKGEIRGDGVKLFEILQGAGHPALVDEG